MNEEEGYDVLRLIEHGRNCYVSSEYVIGKPLIQWLKYHPNLSKKQLFLWISEIAKQLECIHRCRGNPCYKYVNPYSIIVTKQKEVYFLDMSVQSNEKMLSIMERRNVRELFLPQEETYYQTESVSFDIYGLGKTIQYMLSVSSPEPFLTKREEVRFRKIISKCLCRQGKKSYAKVSELRKQIPVYHEPKKCLMERKRILLLAVRLVTGTAGVMLIALLSLLLTKRGDIPHTKEDKIPQEKVQKDFFDSEGLRKELGFLYFLDKKDYAKSKKYFSEVNVDEAVKGLAELSDYMLAGDISYKTEQLLVLLKDIEQSIPEDEEKYCYYRCMLEGYRLLKTREAAQEILRLGEMCMEEADEEIKQVLTGYMATAYEMNEELEKAAESYMMMLTWENRDSLREELYKKLVLLWQRQGENDKAGEICRQGIDELKESVELRILHIDLQCGDSKIEREICAQTIQKYIEEIPEIIEKQEFQKLVNEYDINVEGEKVWVGR